jgi:hypothetical protein
MKKRYAFKWFKLLLKGFWLWGGGKVSHPFKKKAGVSAGSRVKRYLDRIPLKRIGGMACRYIINIYHAGIIVKSQGSTGKD